VNSERGDDLDSERSGSVRIEDARFSPCSIGSAPAEATFTARIGVSNPKALAGCSIDLSRVNGQTIDLLADARVVELGDAVRLEYSFHLSPRDGSVVWAELEVRGSDGTVERASVPLLRGFLWGVVFSPGQRDIASQVSDTAELNADVAKFWLPWSSVQPRVLYYNPDIGAVSDAPAEGFRFFERWDFTIDPDLIEEAAFPERGGRFAELLDWSATDEIIDAITAQGISPVPLVADATTAPFLSLDDATALRIAPEEPDWIDVDCAGGRCLGYAGIGRDRYIDAAFFHVAAAARRYRSVVALWNTENELNWAYVHVLFAGWRKGGAWLDTGFCGRLLKALHDGVEAGDRFALTTMNLNIHDPLWMVKQLDWQDYMDVVGIGAYPNYLFSRPVLSGLLLSSISMARTIGGDRPVMVMETGYPTGPAERGYSVELQESYIESAAIGTVQRGATGYIHFKLDDVPNPPPWREIQAVEHYWGLVDADGSRKGSFDTFGEIAGSH